jgi:hypothetical protein
MWYSGLAWLVPRNKEVSRVLHHKNTFPTTTLQQSQKIKIFLSLLQKYSKTMTVPSTNPDFKESTPLARAEPIYSGARASQAPQTIPMATAIPIVEGSSYQTSKPTNKNQSQFPSVAQATTATTITRYISLGRKPLRVVCPHCQYDGVTRTTKTVSGVGAVSAGAMCFIFWPLFWIPLVCTDVSALLHIIWWLHIAGIEI